MTSLKVKESLVHMEVLCLKNYLSFTLAGIGSSLFVYSNKEQMISLPIFVEERIHGIYIDEEKIFLKGGRQLALVKLDISVGSVNCQFISKIQCSDWIQDIIIYSGSLIGLTTAHNVFEIWDFNKRQMLNDYCCKEKYILYSCKTIGTSTESTIVFAGTVFGNVLIWSPSLQKDEAILQRLQAHNGAVFSVEVNLSDKVLCTTSDDRSLKVWALTSNSPLLLPSQWKSIDIIPVYTLFSHTARVWRSLIVSNFYVTIGEDSQLIVWRDGKLLSSFVLHHRSGIRGLSFSKETNMITTGGEDGGINIIPWNFLTSKIELSEKSIDVGNNFSTRVCFVKDGYVYTKSGSCILVHGAQEKCLYQNQNFLTYCLLEVSPNGEKIFLGSIYGHIVVYDVCRNEILIEDKYLDGRVYSIHCLGNYVLTCGPNGQLDFWEVSKRSLVSIKTFTLPNCKERWSTCAVIKNKNIIVGDRMGNIHIFDLSNSDQSLKTFKKIHSYTGVTDIINDNEFILSVGRDGTLKTFSNNLTHSTTYKLPMEWPWKIIEYENDKLILGFHSVDFVVWSVKHQEVIASCKCGGGHRSCHYRLVENILSFMYLKEKKVFTVDLPLNSIQRLRNSFHGKEINCLKILKSDPSVLVSGSEDTTVRISRLTESDIEEIQTLKTHLSSVRAISICRIDNTRFLIASAGGRAQLVLWTFELQTFKCEELFDYRLKKEDGDWKSVTTCVDPEARFMCLDIVKLKHKFIIAAGCSDCHIRIFSYSNTFSLLCSVPYTHCLLKMSFIEGLPSLFLLSAGTDGKIVFWNLNETLTLSDVRSFAVHQSGINSLELKKVEEGLFFLVTGGDDNMISASCIQFCGNEVQLKKLWSTSSVHSCQITGIKIIKNLLFTTSIDQRITTWKWSFNGKEFDIQYIDQRMTAVSDIQGMDLKHYSDDMIQLIVHGKGVEVLKISIVSS